MCAAPVMRAASVDDVPALTELSAQLGYPGTPEAMRHTLAAVQASPDHAVRVAELDGAVAGWVHVMRTLHLEAGFGVEIAGLVVDARYRGQGVGRALVRWAADWALAQGAERLRVRSRMEREAAHAFYADCGFVTDKVQRVFSLPLRSTPAGAASALRAP